MEKIQVFPHHGRENPTPQ